MYSLYLIDQRFVSLREFEICSSWHFLHFFILAFFAISGRTRRGDQYTFQRGQSQYGSYGCLYEKCLHRFLAFSHISYSSQVSKESQLSTKVDFFHYCSTIIVHTFFCLANWSKSPNLFWHEFSIVCA